MRNLANQWCLGLPGYEVPDSPSSWDIKVGDVIATSHLEFYSSDLLVSDNKNKFARSIGQNDFYQVNAEVFSVSPKICILDFGLRAVCQTCDCPATAQVGDYLAGELCLGMAPSSIVPFEFPGSLRYRWKVNRIRADHTPQTSAVSASGPYFWYAHKNPVYRDVGEVKPTFDTSIVGYLLDCAALE